MTLRGLTWDHPRGYDALAEAARRVNAGRAEPLILWDKQPLEGFESAPITDLCAKYDLVVLDHPHIGEAVAAGCLVPLEEVFAPQELTDWAAQTVGPAFRSYGWEGLHWALPLDVATQVMARRADLLPDGPDDWDAVEALATQGKVALSLGGPHAFLNLISTAAGQGAVIGGDNMLPDAVALPALARLQRLAALAPDGSAGLNPIALLEAMARSDRIALVPLIFGYVTYARSGHAPHPICFSDSLTEAAGLGGVLGGTGIAMSRRARIGPEIKAHLRDLLSVAVQTDLFPAFGGQPSARAAWHSKAVNADAGHFYANTLRTAESALLRPRFDGFPTFCNTASALIRADFAKRTPPQRTLTALRGLWRDARAQARGSLDDERY